MELNQLVKNDKNLLDYIEYFKDMDTTNYWIELVSIFGNRSLKYDVVDIFNEDKMEYLGMYFNLKTEIWKDLTNYSEEIRKMIMLDKITEYSGKDTGKVSKDNKGNVTKKDVDSIVAFDSEEKFNSDFSDNVTDNSSTESVNTENDNNKKVVETGFNKDKFNQTYRLFYRYPDFRFRIYSDIVNVICLQIY